MLEKFWGPRNREPRLWTSEGGRGGLAPLDFENISKKGCFLSFELEKPNFTTFGPLEKLWKNPLVPPPRKKSCLRLFILMVNLHLVPTISQVFSSIQCIRSRKT